MTTPNSSIEARFTALIKVLAQSFERLGMRVPEYGEQRGPLALRWDAYLAAAKDGQFERELGPEDIDQLKAALLKSLDRLNHFDNAAFGKRPFEESLYDLESEVLMDVDALVALVDETDPPAPSDEADSHVDDEELLALVEMEVRELLSDYEYPGEEVDEAFSRKIHSVEESSTNEIRKSSESTSSKLMQSKPPRVHIEYDVGEILAEVGALDPVTPAGQDFDVVSVYYTTDRNRLKTGKRIFGVRRGDAANPLSHGVCAVSIPHDRKIGEMNSPNWKRFEFRYRPDKHIGILGEQPVLEEDFYPAMSKLMRANGTLLFVHGYRVSFVDAVRTTAQLKYDFEFQGVAQCFSWPSRGTLKGYFSDANVVLWSAHNLQAHVEQLLASCPVGPIYIIAHSMGNRALLDMLSRISSEHAQRIAEIIMAAPDVDSGAFGRLVEAFNEKRADHTRMTLYASSEDFALKRSRDVNGGVQRAGDTEPHPTIADRVETIDASAIPTPSLINHSYHQQSRPIINDISYIIDRIDIADRKGLDEKDHNGKTYWKMRP